MIINVVCQKTCSQLNESRAVRPAKLAWRHYCNGLTIHVPCPTQERMDFSHFRRVVARSASSGSVHATATHCHHMVETSRIPRFLFWNECYRFAPNAKFHSATKDREIDKRVELSRRKYSSRKVCSQNKASLVAKVQSLLWLTAQLATTKIIEQTKVINYFRYSKCACTG